MADPRPLFRPEAVEAQRLQWLGGVQLVRPPSLAWLTAGVVVVALALGAFLSLAQYTRKATSPGVVVPDRGLIRLVPAAAGTVLERRVAEGQAVRAGDVLFVLALERPLLSADAQAVVRRSLDERRRSLAEAAGAQQALAGTQRAALERRLAAMEGELAQLDVEAGLQQQRLAMAEQNLARLQSLQADQFISAAQTQAKAEEVLGLKVAAQGLQRQRAALLRERAELEGERRALPLVAGAALGSLARDLAQADRDAVEQGAEQRLVVRAPQSGTVSTLLAEPGQSVSPASALATLMPEGAVLQAQLFAPSSAIGFVQPGQAVRLRFEAFPYQKFGQQPARVLQVSRTPLAASELAALALPAVGAGAEPLFRITVALEGEPVAPLSAGMRLQADVLLERRRLIEWLFEPLLGLKGRL
ncbi:HlyD family secretion protein [Rubrivivax rivuli]|uniref:HlyD family efflux transporter periplasmic adaptor subunit n=1 Tax=Rubrivivax rivuli TaxID=1862385 RepID=A0A437RRP4_9BURK|nr:HlyD family efflux transporter periplasmic adaptor subunit [Rubrivivax rivuli]RVU49449.1 HlyD family efflux transporter periplasmic adaptor subunit [Rubrivivax rivuli]